MSRCRTIWDVSFRGGFVDGWYAEVDEFPQPLVFLWPTTDLQDKRSGIDALMTFDVENAPLNAIVYTRTALDEEQMIAVYEIGDVSPDERVWEFEMVGAGFDEC